MHLKVGKYLITTESLNSLIVVANLILDTIERGIDLVKELIPDDCEVKEEENEKKPE